MSVGVLRGRCACSVVAFEVSDEFVVAYNCHCSNCRAARGDHQFYKGYALVLLKEHVREPFELPPDVQREHFAEVMRAAKAIHDTFSPWKLNYSCYGNAEPHVHWHIVPRYQDDLNRDGDPWRAWRAWRDATPVSEQNISGTQARHIATQIRENLL